MKRYFSILSAIVLSSLLCHVFAQTRGESRIDIGAKAGMTLSKMNFRPSVPQTMVPGFMAGVSFRYAEERHFGLIGEVNLSQRGWKEKYENLDFSYNRKLTYIQIPMMTHIFFGNDKMRGYFNAGPEIGFMIGNSTSANFDYTDVTQVAGYPMTNRETAELAMPVKFKLDYGICAGVGFEYQVTSRNSIGLEGRFYYGLHDIFPNHKSDVFSASNGMSIQLNLSYLYRVK